MADRRLWVQRDVWLAASGYITMSTDKQMSGRDFLISLMSVLMKNVGMVYLKIQAVCLTN